MSETAAAGALGAIVTLGALAARLAVFDTGSGAGEVPPLACQKQRRNPLRLTLYRQWTFNR